MDYGILKNNFLYPNGLIFLLILLFPLGGCKKQELKKEDGFVQIQQPGELNVLTLSGSMSYFIYKGEPKGYEYELLSDFAGSYGLKLNIRLAENETKLTEMLLNDEGDLIACNIPITYEGKEQMLYCGREVINQQVLVQRAGKDDKVLKDVPELIGKEVWVVRDSKYYRRLQHLNDELGGGIHIRAIDKDTISVEDLIEMVSRGQIPYTVSDMDLAKLNKTYYQNINIDLQISHPQGSSWAVRKTSPGLAAVLDEWFKVNQNTPRYQAIIKRYFEMSKMPDEQQPVVKPGQISPYDDYFKQYAGNIPWDWRLLAAIAFQESHFYTNRVSWAGATGLMGLMPRTACYYGLSPDSLDNPEGSIRTATRFIKSLNKAFASIEDDRERIMFILAAYNAGLSHIYDAQALTQRYEKDPLVWEDNVEEYLKLKSLPEYYNDSVCKQGYFRGTETINYVRSVMDRWQYYQEKNVGAGSARPVLERK